MHPLGSGIKMLCLCVASVCCLIDEGIECHALQTEWISTRWQGDQRSFDNSDSTYLLGTVIIQVIFEPVSFVQMLYRTYVYFM